MAIDWKNLRYRGDTNDVRVLYETYRVGDYLETFEENGRQRVRFGIHPVQRRTDTSIECTADILDERDVTDSGGHRERRIVIQTPMVVGEKRWPIEVTLTSRDTMQFRMLLGRTAVKKRFLVNPARSYLAGKPVTSHPR